MTAPLTPEAEKIAAGLTEAQRNALLFAKGRTAAAGGRLYLSIYLHEGTRKALRARGLCHGLLLTALGTAVREVLQREDRS
jgi:hypothetical protein